MHLLYHVSSTLTFLEREDLGGDFGRFYTYVHTYIHTCMYVCIYRFQNVVLRCPTPRLHRTVRFSEPLSRFFSTCVFFPGDGVLAHRPNTQPGGPVYLSLSGCSPLTCPARVALPVATLPPALLSGSLHHANSLTRQKMPSSRWRYFKEGTYIHTSKT